MLKRLSLSFIVLFALIRLTPPLSGIAESVNARVVNLVEDPEASYAFDPQASILEIVFPRVYSSDCALLRMDNQTMLIDASSKNETMRNRIYTALDTVGVDHIDIAYNSHPHDDHIDSFQYVHEYAPIGTFLISFPPDYDKHMRSAVRFMEENNIPIQNIKDGDVLTLGENAQVTMTVIRRDGLSSWPLNDRSSMLLVQYNECRILFTGDNENRSQKSYVENPPACGLKADILKYPHHGQEPLNNHFLKAISPELAFLNGGSSVVKKGVKYCKQKQLPFLLSYKGLTRMRTDGHIWVVDYLAEVNADRELPFTPSRDE